MNRVGHAFIKRRMRDEDAIFGGEVTGHYYFRDNFYADNGFIPALLMLELMSKKHAVARRAARAAPGEVLHLGRDQHQGRQHGGARRQAARPSRASSATAAVTKLDGVSVEYDDWHFNVRASNTEPLIRLNLEADDAGADGEEAGRGAGGDQGVESLAAGTGGRPAGGVWTSGQTSTCSL